MKLSVITCGILLFWPVRVAADEVRVRVQGLTCSSCAVGVQSELRSIKGVQEVIVDPSSQSIIIRMFGNMTLPDSYLREKLEAAGYTVKQFVTVRGPEGFQQIDRSH